MRHEDGTEYTSLTPAQAWDESKKGTKLYFGDGYPENLYIDCSGDLLAIDPCDGIAFHARFQAGDRMLNEWFCCCWKEAVQPLKLSGLAWQNRNEQE